MIKLVQDAAAPNSSERFYFFAYFLRDEILTPVKMIGIAVVVSGLFLSQVPREKMRKVFAFVPVGLITRARLRKD